MSDPDLQHAFEQLSMAHGRDSDSHDSEASSSVDYQENRISGYDDLQDALQEVTYIEAEFEEKLEKDGRRRHDRRNGLRLFPHDPKPLVQRANQIYAGTSIHDARLLQRKANTERNYRNDKEDTFHMGPPVLYRVIHQLDYEHLLCEAVFGHESLTESWLDYVVLSVESYEGPAFYSSGFNLQFVDTNDLVWVYDVFPYEGPQINGDENFFIRAAYNKPRNVYWASRAHSFLESSEFHTAHGYMVDSDGSAAITGSDRLVNISGGSLARFLGGTPAPGQVFRFDYVSDKNYHFLSRTSGSTTFYAGFPITLKRPQGYQTVYVVAASVLTGAMEKMMNPVARCKDYFEYIDMQTLAYTLGKYTDAAMKLREADEVIVPATVEWRSVASGVVTLTSDVDNFATFKGEILLLVIPNVIKVMIKLLPKRTYRKKPTREEEMRRDFMTFPVDRQNLQPLMQRIEQISNVTLSPVEPNPTEDDLLRYLYTGNMRRQLKNNLRDEGPINRKLFTAMRNGEFRDVYRHDDSPVERMPFKYNNKDVLLDEEQTRGVHFITKHKPLPPAVVIEACAGAGKTLCSLALMVETMRMDPDCVQFMCASTNRAVDNMAQSLSTSEEARPIRLFSKTALEKLDGPEPQYSFNGVIQKLLTFHAEFGVTEQEQYLLADYRTLTDNIKSGSNNPAEMGTPRYRDLLRLKKRAESAVCHIVVGRYKPNVILTTVDMALRDMLSGLEASLCKQKFFRILIDEASQLDEPKLNALLSLNVRTSQVVLVGDPTQLPPHMEFTTPPALRKLCGRSALDAMLEIYGIPVVQLRHGYRMHPDLLALTSEAFYDGSLTSAGTGPWQSKEAKWKRLNGESRVAVGLVGGQETWSGKSRANEKEAKIANALVREAIADGVAEKDICVVCLYKGQMHTVRKLLSRTSVEIATCDSLQGREKDYIIVLTTRSTTSDYSSTFYSDTRRANVATSRAILGMVVLGEAGAMRNSLPWSRVLTFAERHNIIQRDLESLLS